MAAAAIYASASAGLVPIGPFVPADPINCKNCGAAITPGRLQCVWCETPRAEIAADRLLAQLAKP